MDPPYSGFVNDPSKCCDLTINEKRELVHKLSKWPEKAPEKLLTWSRRDLIEILCAEMGKERKYSGVAKQKLIEHLFKVLSDKKSGKLTEVIEGNPQLPSSNNHTPSKRQRKTDHPSRLLIETSLDYGGEASRTIRICENVVCRATLRMEMAFCERCTCGICYKYDENKDPSLWLVCNSDFPYKGDSCGISYHVECVLNHERGGIMKSKQCVRLDGGFYCIYCQKVNDLLACWRKQLMYAKDARRVDTLCQRISLSHRFLYSTEKYQKLHEIVDKAMRKLESETGPLSDFSSMARGIVSRLSVGAEVQRLCAQAIELLDSMFSSGIQHKKSPALLPQNLIRIESNNTPEHIEKEETSTNSGSGLEEDPNPVTHEINEATLPVTPSRLEPDKPNPSSNSHDNGISKPGDKDGSSLKEEDYEYCVKVIRWLECKGHIETIFRVKFLTWFSLRASPQEKKIIRVYLDTLIEDPESLAGQLVDTFSEAVYSKRQPPVTTGFCVKLWH